MHVVKYLPIYHVKVPSSHADKRSVFAVSLIWMFQAFEHKPSVFALLIWHSIKDGKRASPSPPALNHNTRSGMKRWRSITRHRSRAFPLEAAWMTLQQIEIDGHLTSGRMTFAVYGVNLDSQENKMQYLKPQFFQYCIYYFIYIPGHRICIMASLFFLLAASPTWETVSFNLVS